MYYVRTPQLKPKAAVTNADGTASNGNSEGRTLNSGYDVRLSSRPKLAALEPRRSGAIGRGLASV